MDADGRRFYRRQRGNERHIVPKRGKGWLSKREKETFSYSTKNPRYPFPSVVKILLAAFCALCVENLSLLLSCSFVPAVSHLFDSMFLTQEFLPLVFL